MAVPRQADPGPFRILPLSYSVPVSTAPVPAAAQSNGGPASGSNGSRFRAQIGSTANFEFKNFWNGGWWVGRRFSAINPGVLRRGPAVHQPSSWQGNLHMGSDRRKSVTMNASVNGALESETDSWILSFSPSISIRPSSQINLSVGTGLGRARNTWQYVGQPRADGDPDDPRYVVAALNQTTVSLATRLNCTISPELSFEVYAQPFISGGDYEAFRTVGDPRR